LIEKADVNLSDLNQRVVELTPDQMDLAKLLQSITLNVGKSLRSVTQDSALEYAKINPSYFDSGKPQ
jgi:hypothetical protein